MKWKYTWRGVWIAAKGGRYYMKDYNFRPLNKSKRITEITEKEYRKYFKCVV